MWRFAVVCVAACWTGKAGTSAVPADHAPAMRDVSGSYWCSFTESEYDEERQPCVIQKVGDKMILARLAGQERIRGQITLDDHEGFTFAGELYCPFGDCTQSELHGRFKPVGRGGFKGTFRDEALIVHLAPAPGAFGGTAYGGETYGSSDDDDLYGGRGYGRARPIHRIDIRGRRR